MRTEKNRAKEVMVLDRHDEWVGARQLVTSQLARERPIASTE